MIVNEQEINTTIARRMGWTGEHETDENGLGCWRCKCDGCDFENQPCPPPSYTRDYEALSAAEREVYGRTGPQSIMIRYGWVRVTRRDGHPMQISSGMDKEELHARAECLARIIEAEGEAE